MKSTLRPLSFFAGTVTCVLAVSGAAEAQNARLSTLSAFQPDTLLHVGISTPDKQFTRCTLLVSAQGPSQALTFQGVPVVIDPVTAIAFDLEAQHAAGPASQPTYPTRWSLNVPLPPSLPVGLPLRFQALLSSSPGSSSFALTNGAVRSIAPPAPTEQRWCARLRRTKNASGTTTGVFLHLDQIDVDRGVLSATAQEQVPTASPAKWQNYRMFAPPQVSSDGETAVISLEPGYGQNGLLPDAQVFVLDMAASAQAGTVVGGWLPLNGLQRAVPRFLPGQNDRFWIAERWPAGSAWNTRLVCYSTDPTPDAITGLPYPKLHEIDVETNSGDVLQEGWDFDDAGTAAWLLNETQGIGGPVWVDAFPVVGGAVTGPSSAVVLTNDGDTQYWGTDNVQPFGGDRMVASIEVNPGGYRSTFVMDLTGAALPHVQGNSTTADVSVSPDRAYALITDHVTYPTFPVLDGAAPFAAGQPLAHLPDAKLPGGGSSQEYHLVVDLPDGAMLFQNDALKVAKITRNGGLLETERLHFAWDPQHNIGFFKRDGGAAIGNRGCAVPFGTGPRRGAVLRLYETGGNDNTVLGGLDAETLTHAWRVSLPYAQTYGFCF